MPETEAVETTDEEIVESEEEVEDSTAEEVAEDPTAGLRKALAAERKARKDAERKERESSLALADRDKEPAEQALDQARREAREEARTAFNARLVQAELRVALAGKVNNAALALKVIDTSVIDVDENGDIDPQSVMDAVEAALTEYPELKPVDATKFQGTADQGARGKSAQTPQMTQAEFDRIKSNPHAVMKAKEDGRLNRLLGIET